MNSRQTGKQHSLYYTPLFERYTEAIYDCHELENKIVMLHGMVEEAEHRNVIEERDSKSLAHMMGRMKD